MDNSVPEETQSENSLEQVVEQSDDSKVVEEAKGRTQAFQEAYKKLCAEFKCSHRANINATLNGIFPSFVISISKDEPKEEKSAEKSE